MNNKNDNSSNNNNSNNIDTSGNFCQQRQQQQQQQQKGLNTKQHSMKKHSNFFKSFMDDVTMNNTWNLLKGLFLDFNESLLEGWGEEDMEDKAKTLLVIRYQV